MDVKEMTEVLQKAKNLLDTPAADFRVYSDVRGFKPANLDVQEVMKTIQALFRRKGLKKVAVLVDGIITKMQLRRLHEVTGIGGTDQFFSADEANYEQKIEDFLTTD